MLRCKRDIAHHIIQTNGPEERQTRNNRAVNKAMQPQCWSELVPNRRFLRKLIHPSVIALWPRTGISSASKKKGPRRECATKEANECCKPVGYCNHCRLAHSGHRTATNRQTELQGEGAMDVQGFWERESMHESKWSGETGKTPQHKST